MTVKHASGVFSETITAPVIVASDMLAVLLVAVKQHRFGTEFLGRVFFNCYEMELQHAIFELQQELPRNMLNVFVYGEYPWSPLLSEALTHLTASGWIGRPDFAAPRLLELKPTAEQGVRQMVVGDLDGLRTLTEAFERKIRCVHYD